MQSIFILFKLINISQLSSEFMTRLTYIIQVQFIMNSVSKHREALRNDRRKDDILKFKTNMRNLIYYNQQSNLYLCALCQDERWIHSEDVNNILELLVSIFNSKPICDKHLQVFLQITFRCLQNQPSIYCKLFSLGSQLTRQLVIRKILFILQIFDKKDILQNEKIWEEIVYTFNSKSQFIVKVMDCAYSFGEWDVVQFDQNWDMQIKSICFTTVLNIIGKYPYLFVGYFDEYPLNLLLEKTKHYSTINLLYIMHSIINSDEQQQLSSLTNYIYSGFQAYLSSIKHIPQTLQAFTALMSLTYDLTKVGFNDGQFQSNVIYLVQNNNKFKEEAYSIIIQVFQKFNTASNQSLEMIQQLNSLQRIRQIRSKMQIQLSKQMQIE